MMSRCFLSSPLGRICRYSQARLPSPPLSASQTPSRRGSSTAASGGPMGLVEATQPERAAARVTPASSRLRQNVTSLLPGFAVAMAEDSPASRPVVGMSGEDLLGAVELFDQHDAHQHMRPGHRA